MIAGSAIFRRPMFAKITKQANTPTLIVFREMRHLVELPMCDPACLLVRAIIEKFQIFHDVAA